jgi:hypothetical protein
MTQSTIKPRIGFVSGGAGTMPHYQSLLPVIPKQVELDFQGLELYGTSLYEIADKKAVILSRLKELAAVRRWDGVILTAAPTEVLNPGLYEDLKTALSVPFTAALHVLTRSARMPRLVSCSSHHLIGA